MNGLEKAFPIPLLVHSRTAWPDISIELDAIVQSGTAYLLVQVLGRRKGWRHGAVSRNAYTAS